MDCYFRLPGRRDTMIPCQKDLLTIEPLSFDSAPMTQTLLSLLARLFSGYSVRWIGCQPESCQRVYFANHTPRIIGTADTFADIWREFLTPF